MPDNSYFKQRRACTLCGHEWTTLIRVPDAQWSEHIRALLACNECSSPSVVSYPAEQVIINDDTLNTQN